MTDPALLPCPWCGNVPEWPRCIHKEHERARWVCIKCPSCDAMGPEVRYPLGTTQWDWKAELISEWNKRPSDPQRDRATALLRRVLDGPRPAHGPLDVYDDIAKFLRETDNG